MPPSRLRLFRPFAHVAVLVVACGHASPPRAGAPQRAPRADAPAEEPPIEEARLEDERIADAVRGELAVDPAVDPSRLSVEVADGVVELRGEVPHLLMSDAAVERAEMVHGVRAVLDLTELPRTTRPDGVVRAQVEEALRAGEAPPDELVVRVVDGVVTLRGSATSFAEKRLAERIARTVRGVREVVNQIEVRHVERDDAEILADVRAALRADRWVDEWLLTPEVDEGVVSLRGVQPTAAAKRRAIDAAWVEGVRAVDATLVEVEPELPPALRRPPAGHRYPDDAEIVRSIRTAIARDPRVAGAQVEASSQDGIVTLTGTVRSLAAREAAAETAETISGVWRVDNRLEVRARPAPTDAEIAREAERAIARAAAIDEDAVTVEVSRGVVTLLGSVATPYARIVAEEVIGRIPGVRGLDNRIEAPERAAPPLGDAELLQNVIAHLEAHPYVDRDRIQVTVANGEVMLRGQVEDWRAAREAVRAAYEAGATNVLDDIEVVQP